VDGRRGSAEKIGGDEICLCDKQEGGDGLLAE